MTSTTGREHDEARDHAAPKPGADAQPTAADAQSASAEWLHESVVDRIGIAIVSGTFPSGSVVRSEELESRFGVSRSVVREAVRVLESLGALSSRRGVGITVMPLREWSLFDPRIIRWRLAGADRAVLLEELSQLRAGIEPEAAALAATHASGDQCARLVGAVLGMSATGRRGDLEAYLRHDIDFHTTLLEASGNDLFRALSKVIAEVLTSRTRLALMPERPEPRAIRLHSRIADAIQRGEATEAEAAMREVVRESMAAMAELLKDGGG
jgi:DNA-binding FadR family transcriptional regulator